MQRNTIHNLFVKKTLTKGQETNKKNKQEKAKKKKQIIRKINKKQETKKNQIYIILA